MPLLFWNLMFCLELCNLGLQLVWSCILIQLSVFLLAFADTSTTQWRDCTSSSRSSRFTRLPVLWFIPSCSSTCIADCGWRSQTLLTPCPTTVPNAPPAAPTTADSKTWVMPVSHDTFTSRTYLLINAYKWTNLYYIANIYIKCCVFLITVS